MRQELTELKYNFNNPFEVLEIFENKLANFFGSKHAVLVDSCTHGLELCFRILKDDNKNVSVPVHTYMSVPMMLSKLNLDYSFRKDEWNNYYKLGDYNIYDAAVLWKQNSYISNSYMCVSFQIKKHIKIGRGGVILLDNTDHYELLKKLRYDGRDLTKPHAEDDVEFIGYHYYMTPEDAALGIILFDENAYKDPEQWSWKNYKNLKEYKVFDNVELK